MSRLFVHTCIEDVKDDKAAAAVADLLFFFVC